MWALSPLICATWITNPRSLESLNILQRNYRSQAIQARLTLLEKNITAHHIRHIRLQVINGHRSNSEEDAIFTVVNQLRVQAVLRRRLVFAVLLEQVVPPFVRASGQEKLPPGLDESNTGHPINLRTQRHPSIHPFLLLLGFLRRIIF